MTTVAWIGPLPPPVHGASLVTARLLDRVRATGADVRVVSVAGTGAGWRHHLSRLTGHLAALALVLGLPRRATVYVSLSGGLGLWYQVPVVALARLRGHRLVVHHHSYAYLSRRSAPMAAIARLLGAGDRQLVLSAAMRGGLLARYRTRAEVAVVSNAWFIDPPHEPRVHRPGPLRVVHVSNLCAAKGSGAVVATARLLDEATVTLVGPCHDEGLRAAIAAAPVRWCGPLPTAQVYAELDDADVFLFPSSYVNEAEPLVVLEALSRGIPVVATRRGALSELLPDAWLVDSDRPEDLAARVRVVAGDPDGRTRARALFAALRGEADPVELVLARRRRRVLQVLPSFDPAFGGPVSAALGVTAAYPDVALHTVGTGTPDRSWAPFATTGFPGVSSPVGPRHVLTLSPRLLAWVARHLRGFDLLHLHFARSMTLVWLPLLARLVGVPYVLQTHGMCSPWRGPRAVLDVVFTRPALRHARTVCVLSDGEADEIRAMAPHTRIVVLHNAVLGDGGPTDEVRGGGRPRLLFCARLHPRKGLDTFLDVVERLGGAGGPSDGPSGRVSGRVEAHVVGADEGAGAAARDRVAAAGLPVTFHGGLDGVAVAGWMATCDVLVHPAAAEPFGMSMLEAFAAGLPVVASASSRLAPIFAAEGAALLPRDGELDEWEAAVTAVLDDDGVRAGLRDGGRAVLERHFSRASLRRTLDEVVTAAVPR